MLTIDRNERELLYRALMLDLSAIDDVFRLLAQGRIEEAREDRQRFEDAWALLDTIGWEADDPRQTFELALPADQLERILRREDEFAEEGLQDTARDLLNLHPWPDVTADELCEWRREKREEADDLLDLRATCRRVLDGLAG